MSSIPTIKLTSCFVLSLSLCFSLSGQSLRCCYLHEYTVVENRKCFLKDYNLCIEIDGEHITCYSENEFLKDSTITAMFAAGEGYSQTQNSANKYPDGVSWFIFGNLQQGSYTEYNSHFALFFEGHGVYEQPEWTLSDETAEICGYLCTKASAQYLGRFWTIWFTPDIPVNAGPWLLWGAPGLILKAEDDQGLFRFSCEMMAPINHLRRETLLEHFKETSDRRGGHYYVRDIAEMEILYTKVKRFPAFNDELTGSITSVYDSNGQKKNISSLPYIPLIPDEYWENN